MGTRAVVAIADVFTCALASALVCVEADTYQHLLPVTLLMLLAALYAQVLLPFQ